MWMRLLGATATAVVALNLAGCDSDGLDYKTATCADWLKIANSDDPIAAGLLDAGNDFLDASPVDPRSDNASADFADTVSGVCSPERLATTKVIDLQDQIVDVFLSVHPEDAP